MLRYYETPEATAAHGPRRRLACDRRSRLSRRRRFLLRHRPAEGTDHQGRREHRAARDRRGAAASIRRCSRRRRSAIADPDYGQEILACVVLKADATCTEDELRAHCLRRTRPLQDAEGFPLRRRAAEGAVGQGAAAEARRSPLIVAAGPRGIISLRCRVTGGATVFIGHLGLAFAAKKVAPRPSLGTLALAAQLVDGVWPVFLLLGWEKVEIVPGITAVTPLLFASYPYTHSLAAGAVWALLLAGGYYLLRHDGVGAGWIAALVVSHWILDFISHRPDMPLWPRRSEGRSRSVEFGSGNARRRIRALRGRHLAVCLGNACARPRRDLGARRVRPAPRGALPRSGVRTAAPFGTGAGDERDPGLAVRRLGLLD